VEHTCCREGQSLLVCSLALFVSAGSPRTTDTDDELGDEQVPGYGSTMVNPDEMETMDVTGMMDEVGILDATGMTDEMKETATAARLKRRYSDEPETNDELRAVKDDSEADGAIIRPNTVVR
jgi:hypothetical protein